MKEGDIVTEEELENEGYKHLIHLSGGTHAYTNDTHWIAYNRSTGKVELYKERAKFSYP